LCILFLGGKKAVSHFEIDNLDKEITKTRSVKREVERNSQSV
jgi:hypothetical protein